MNMNDQISSLIRTYVPGLVAFIAAQLASLGVEISDATSASLVYGIGGVAGAVWYAFARWAEQRWPAVSWMLGSSQQPSVYVKGKK